LMGSGCRLMELVLRLTGNGGSTTLLWTQGEFTMIMFQVPRRQEATS
jgi:hypothetical protein